MTATIVPGDCASFDFFSADDSYNTTAWTNRPDVSTPENMAVFAEYVHQHKMIPIALEKKDGRAMKMTDVIRQQDFERTELFNEFYRKHQFNRQMGLALPVASDLTVSCAVTSGGRDFTERDRLMLTLAAPHMLNAIRNAIAYERIDTTLKNTGSGILSLDPDGKVIFMTDSATELFEAYFAGDGLAANGVPTGVLDWATRNASTAQNVETDAPPPPLTVVNSRGTLTVRLMLNHSTRERTLLFGEERATRPDIAINVHNLTTRETEILFWIKNGKSNSVIAEILGISMRTVHKHVEHIYQKLGVETRTAAILIGLEIL